MSRFSLRLGAVLLCLLFARIASALTNGVALTPPMGFNSWYSYGSGINEGIIESVASQMATNGMLAAGYQYINVDDGWAGYRDTNGVMVADTNKFPNGMKAVADYVHGLGFKFGLYTTASTNTCANYPGSVNHFLQDAQTYASWGVDYLKYEGCDVSPYEITPRQEIYVARMQQALAQSGRPMVFSVSVPSFENWMPYRINAWRGTGDINNNWSTVLSHIDYVSQTPSFAGPGGWNDMDVMPLGGGFSDIEIQSIFSLWCILDSPLLTSNPGGQYLTPFFCNTDAIAVNQDAAGIQGVCVSSNGDCEVFSKPLGGPDSTTVAVALFNRGTNTVSITANWSDLGLPPIVATVYDLWQHVYAGNFTNSYTTTLPAHGVQFVKIVSGATMALPPAGTNYLSDLPWLAGYTNAIFFSNNAPVNLDEAACGSPITLHGVVYEKGLGMLVYTRISYFLGHATSRFLSDVGIDDAAGTPGAVIFRVYLDGVKSYDSGVMNTSTPTQGISLDTTGHEVLTLEALNSVSDGVNGYADWGGARMVVEASPTALTASTVGSELEISWNATPGAVGYEVFRATSSNGPFVLLTNLPYATFTDTNVSPDATYYYEVATVTSAGVATNSAALAAILTPFWTDTNSGAAQEWSEAGNWLNTATFPNRAGLGVVVNAPLISNQTILLTQAITIGSLTIGATNGYGSYVIEAEGGSLTFDNGLSWFELGQSSTSQGDTIAAPITLNSPVEIDNLATNPFTISGAVTLGSGLTVSNNSPGAVVLSGTISGAGALVQNSAGVLELSGSNTLTGGITVLQGTLRTGNSGALGGADAVTEITNGAVLDVNGFGLGAAQVMVSGSGLDGNGAIINSANAQSSALQFVTLTGDATFGGSGSWDLRGATNGVVSGALSTGGIARNLVKTGTNQISLADVAIDAALPNIDVQEGILSVENSTTSLGNPAATLTVETGATLAFNQTTTAWNKNFQLNGDGVTSTLLSISGNNSIAGPMTLNGECIFETDGGMLSVNGPLLGSGDLEKISGGTLALGAANSFTGEVNVGGGTLALMNSNALAGNANITVGAGAVLDVSGLNGGGWTLAADQTLGGGGAINGNLRIASSATLAPANELNVLTFSNALTFLPGSACVMEVNHLSATNDVLRVAGTLTYAGTLVINNIGGVPLAAGDTYRLFDAASYAGGVANISPQIPGQGLVWDATGLASNGVLRLAVGSVPLFTSVKARGNQLVMSGAGGASNKNYFILASTNLSLPPEKWSCVATNVFDGSGNFGFTNTISPTAPATFYLLQVQ